MKLTPGLSLILWGIPRILLPPCFIYIAFDLAGLPFHWILLACLLATPIWLIIVRKWYDVQLGREVHRHGAQSVPEWAGKWPGNIDLLLEMMQVKAHGYLGDRLDDAMEQFGNVFNTRFLGFDRVWTSDPRHIKLILATDFEGYAKGDNWQYASKELLGHGVFSADGDMWKFHRNITRPFFTRDRISDLEIFGRHVDGAIVQVKQHLREGYPIDIQDMLTRITLDSGTAFLFGSCVDSLSAGLIYPRGSAPAIARDKAPEHHSDSFARSFIRGQETLSDRMLRGRIWPLAEIFADAIAPDRAVVDRFLDPILEEALFKKKNSASTSNEKVGEEDNFLEYLVSQTDDVQLLRDELLNILIAARDTTAALVTFVFYLLSQHPDVTVKLRAEILAECGLDRPDYTQIKNLKYLRAVINETLRLFPPVPFNTRETTRSTTWPSRPGEKPYYLPNKTVIAYSVFYMHRNTEFWGPDALEFDPDRFLDDRVQKYLTPNPFIFLPFNAGPRLCLGQQFAYNQASYIITRLLQSFDSVSLAPEAQPEGTRPPAVWKLAPPNRRKRIEEFFPKSHVTMYSAGGLWIRMQEARLSE